MSLRIVIIEDEPATARNLKFMLQELMPGIEVLASLTGVKQASDWLKNEAGQCDLIFMDIRLNDGLSFEIFDNVKIEVPVIFITAYNEYALQAFKSNGIDYILKPFDETELQHALAKYGMLNRKEKPGDNYSQLKQMLETLKTNENSYKQSFLVHFRDKLIPVSSNDIAWFYTSNELVIAKTLTNIEYNIDFTLEQLQQQLDPKNFFRTNRQFIINRKSIVEIQFFFNSKLVVKVYPEPGEKVLISKARVPEFKKWMNT